MNSRFCYLYLTCASKAESEKIATHLLQQRLIVCAKHIPIRAAYWWRGKIESGNEILLAMESRPGLFEEIENEVASLHSYGTFVLEAVPVSNVSKAASRWMDDNLK